MSRRNGKGAGIGKGNPPKDTQFVKGRSGNPDGRPKGSRNLETIIRQAANAPVMATIDGRKKRISKTTATAIQLATKAAGGDKHAGSQLFQYLWQFEAEAASTKPAQFPFEEADLKVLRAIYERMMLCANPMSKAA